MAYAQSLILIDEVWVQALHPYKPLTTIPITTNSNAIALQSSTNAKSDRFCGGSGDGNCQQIPPVNLQVGCPSYAPPLWQ